MRAAYLIVHNVAKRSNYGQILRTAAAFGVREVAIVGAPKLCIKGDFGTANHLRFCHFRRLSDSIEYMRTVHNATICGIEVDPDAEPVQAHPFRGSTAFLLGNEGSGLSKASLSVCDHLVYIPQHGQATASLNVNAACAVVLHHFAMYSALPEAPRDGAKFVVATPQSLVPRSGVGLRQMRTDLAADGRSTLDGL